MNDKEWETLLNIKKKILGIFFELPEEGGKRPTSIPKAETRPPVRNEEAASPWDRGKKKTFEILSDIKISDDDAVNTTLQQILTDMQGHYENLGDMIADARSSVYKPGVIQGSEITELVKRRAIDTVHEK